MKEDKTGLLLNTSQLTVRIQKTPFQIIYFHKKKEILSEHTGFFADENGYGVSFLVRQREFITGAGERGGRYESS
ncbi:MAG: hypothetical protein IPM26_10750, partial [Saprospiraceae bacterium]|nr:hypothetical protein [Saprospiraceae bacterium]